MANGEVVRAIIGHTTEAMTHHYSHVGEDEKREAVMRVFSLIKGGERVVSGVVDTEIEDAAPSPKTENPAGAGSSVRGATRI